MKHPTSEQWMAFLYGEVLPNEQADWSAHLQGCAECSARVKVWRRSMGALDQWPAPEARRPAPALWPAFKWAAAAAIVLSLAFGLGRFSSMASGDVKALQASLESALDQKLQRARVELAEDLKRQQAEGLTRLLAASEESARAQTERLLAEFANAHEDKRAADRQAVVAALKELEARRLNDYATLRKELQTVALLTEESFAKAQQQLVQLASFNQTDEDK